jgi:hypothetical protein
MSQKDNILQAELNQMSGVQELQEIMFDEEGNAVTHANNKDNKDAFGHQQ